MLFKKLRTRRLAKELEVALDYTLNVLGNAILSENNLCSTSRRINGIVCRDREQLIEFMKIAYPGASDSSIANTLELLEEMDYIAEVGVSISHDFMINVYNEALQRNIYINV